MSSKSNQYTVNNGHCKQHNRAQCNECVRTMLVCRVVLGNIFDAVSPMNGISKPPSGYHSIIADPAKCAGLKYKEAIVYDQNQVHKIELYIL
jgi:hypothetical protein